MADFVDLRPLWQPRRAAELTQEAQHYKAYKAVWKQKEASRVIDVAFSPDAPHRLGVVSGTKVAFWIAGKDGAATAANQVSKFKDITQCVAWRGDGKLLLAGEAGGSCAVVETTKFSVLRRLRGHGDAVTCAAFATGDRARCATGSRDGKLRIWDVATSELLHTVDAHQDSIKAIAPGPGGPDGWITAGYDGKVKLWDLRVDSGSVAAGTTPVGGLACGCVVAVDHGSPIEAGCAFPGGALYFSAGGTEVKLWDLVSGGKLVQSMPDAHAKVVTAICLDSTASIFLTASFDGLAKVYRVATMEHLWTYRLPGPATCATWRADGKAFAIGLDDGQWQLREFKAPQQQQQQGGSSGSAAKTSDASTAALFGPGILGLEDPGESNRSRKVSRAKREGHLRGKDAEPEDGDVVVADGHGPQKRSKGLVNTYFRKFEYRKVVELMARCPNDMNGMSIIDEFLQRGELAKAFSDLGEELCLGVLRWLLKALADGDSLQQQMLLEAVHTVLDQNECLQPPRTPALLDAVKTIELRIKEELVHQEVLMETAGMLKTVTGS